ncbi:MAG TPA: DUF1801 domain-containing protein [Phycisphaerae bacterium]
MGKKDTRVDAYIAKASPAAQGVLGHLRKVVHKGCPRVEETIKWGMPFFMYRGMFAHMAAFKAHCGFGFVGSVMRKEIGEKWAKKGESQGQFGRIRHVKDLPNTNVLLKLVRQAAAIADKKQAKTIATKAVKATPRKRVNPGGKPR